MLTKLTTPTEPMEYLSWVYSKHPTLPQLHSHVNYLSLAYEGQRTVLVQDKGMWHVRVGDKSLTYARDGYAALVEAKGYYMELLAPKAK